jgi:hypothetical protein
MFNCPFCGKYRVLSTNHYICMCGFLSVDVVNSLVVFHFCVSRYSLYIVCNEYGPVRSESENFKSEGMSTIDKYVYIHEQEILRRILEV